MQVDLEFYDIFDYYHIPFWQKTWFIVSTCIIAFILITIASYVIYTRLHKRKLSAWEWARKELSALNTNTCTTQADFKKLYYRLTNIIKTYLARRYDWSTHEKTDDEIINFLEKKKFNADIIIMLKKITDDALWIKFANQSTLKSQADNDIQTVLVMIERTTPTKK